MPLRSKTIDKGGNQWKTVEKWAVSLAVLGIFPRNSLDHTTLDTQSGLAWDRRPYGVIIIATSLTYRPGANLSHKLQI
jgi:hypothetical protein